MKNIFKTVNSKWFLLFLVTFLCNLSYGQAVYVTSEGATGTVSQSNYGQATEYDEYGYADMFSFTSDLGYPGDMPADDYYTYGTKKNIYYNLEGSSYYDTNSMFSNYPNSSYSSSGYSSNVSSSLAISSFYRDAMNNTSGQQVFHMVLDSYGNGFASGDSTNNIAGVYTASGQFMDYTNNSHQVTGMVNNNLSGSQIHDLYYLDVVDNYMNLNPVAISSFTNFDHDQFLADVTASYYDNLIAQRDQAYWDNYVSSGVYGPDKDFTHALMVAGGVALPVLAAEGGLVLLGDYLYTEAVASLSQITWGTATRDIMLNTLSQWVANGGDIKEVNWLEAGLSPVSGYGSTILGEIFSYTYSDYIKDKEDGTYGIRTPDSYEKAFLQIGGGLLSDKFGNIIDGKAYFKDGVGYTYGEMVKFMVETGSNALPNAMD